jgi:hypothetical protein
VPLAASLDYFLDDGFPTLRSLHRLILSVVNVLLPLAVSVVSFPRRRLVRSTAH